MAHQTDDLARVLKVLAVGTRLRIVEILQARRLCVGAIASHLDVTQGAVSQHLRVMRDAGLVIAEKRGCHVHYRLNERTLARWRNRIDGLLAPRSAVAFSCSQRARESRRNGRSEKKRSQG